MKNNLLPVGLSAYAIGVIILVIISMTSCSSGAYKGCSAYQNVELQNK